VAGALPDQLVSAARRRGITVTSLEAPLEGVLDAGGVRLRYHDWGGPAARPVVFIHGGALTSRTWDFVCLALRGSFRCIALDLRGHGDSEWALEADDYELHTYADDIRALLVALDLRGPVLVGMSLGGQAALLAAAAEPAIRGLTLVDVGPEPHAGAASRIIESIKRPAEFAELDDAVARALLLNPRRTAEELRSSLQHNLRALPSGSLTWKYDWRAFEKLTPEALAERADALWRAVDTVACPVLIVRGAESAVLGAEQAEALRARLRDGRTTVVEDAGHTVQGDNPAGLVRELEPFLAECFRTPSGGAGSS
jgi:esterase